MKNDIKKILQEVRRDLHQHPEVSGKEFKTSERIETFLQQYKPDDLITSIGTTGIVAIYRGKKSGKNTLFRCELDALPIEESNTFDHRSTINGVSHKCGHDGHMAILCGLAVYLAENKPENGDVYLLFQPSEEDGEGAKKILNDPLFEIIQPDYVFALHNLPGFPLGQIIVKENTFSCAVKSLIIKLNGKTAHAGEPQNGINPSNAIAKIITQFNTFIEPDITQENFCLITPIYINMGKKAYGVSAGAGEIHFTIRSNSNKNIGFIEKKLEQTIQNIARGEQLEFECEYIQEFRANENSPEAVHFIRKSARNNGFQLLEKETPFSWGEDFGLFTEHFTGAMFGLGAGEKIPSLHNPDYDFPDELTPFGVAVFREIIKNIHHA
ncbi:amidohydrolase [Flavobacterium soli]|uniref:amidohydrolase n=1 Tax=Flavobacterium soli TaxID=344881 RepID=UPI00041FD1E9|nr:amidohydrolase [Flavobacterium soli]